MMEMDIYEVRQDTMLVWKNEKVIWGIHKNTICLVWNDKFAPICFNKLTGNKRTKENSIKKVDKFLSTTREEVPGVIIRDIYANRYKEVFLVKVIINEDVLILINRIDDRHPHYFFNTNYKRRLKENSKKIMSGLKE